MPTLTQEELNELWRRQEEQEARHRESLQQAVASSGVPLPPDLAQAVIRLNDKYTRAILRSHRGFTLAERRDSYLKSLAIMEQCLQDLLTAICVFETTALAEPSTLFNRNNNDALNRFERQIQKELFATANAAVSLVDHARRVHKCNPLAEYDTKRVECFGTDGLHDFVTELRVLLHHLHVVEAGWSIETSFSEGTKTATFTVSKETILRVIAADFERPAKAAMLAFVHAAADHIDLRVLLYDYRARVAKFNEWLKKELASDSLIALRDYDSLIQRKVNADQLMFWKAMMGNWLRSKSPPDPHKHLPRFLSGSQLEKVNALPRNSKEQVNLVIRFMDKHNATDDVLREQAYELFRRSPDHSL